MKKLVFPLVSRPTVSIVMVTFGGWRWVRRALSAVIENGEPRYEMIVVDNASPRGMGRRLRQEVENARIVENDSNRGFGPANNQGAALATGSLIVFLNSDAMLHPQSLSLLRERIESDSSVGAAAPRLLNLDGTLQEAGALLFANGYTQFVGFGDEPEKPAYLFPRELDYGSAACLMVRRTAFFEVGGFDALYAPAYYEDVDLCLALRRKGYRTVYEPGALVTHVRGASGTPQISLRLWARNHPLFADRWKSFLATRPEYTPADGNSRLQAAARDAPASGRILLVTDRFPGAAPAGDPRALELVRWLTTLYPAARRTLLSSELTTTTRRSRDLARLGWEVADLDSVASRRFHYDAVIFRGRDAERIFGDFVDEKQAPAARILDADDAMSEAAFVDALASAGIPPQNLPETRFERERLLPRVRD